MVKSDNGQNDPGLPQDFDLAALSVNAYGPLSTEVPHQLKVGGYYVLSDQLRFGATARSMKLAMMTTIGSVMASLALVVRRWSQSGPRTSMPA